MKGVTSRTIIGMVLGWAIVFEGFFALSIANTATIDGIGGIRASTFALAAAQLVGLGVLISAIWAFELAFPRIDRPWLRRGLEAVAYAAMALVAVEGVAIVLLAGDVMVADFGGVGKRWIALIGAQLFGLAALSLRSWRLRKARPWNPLVDALGSIIAVIIMVEGLTAMGIAANATIDGFGTILGRTMYLAGAQLLLLGLAAFILWTVREDPWLGPRISKWVNERRSLILMVAIGSILMAEAVIASTVAGIVRVDGASGASKIYVVAGIAQLFALGLMTPILWKLRVEGLHRSFLPSFLAPVAMAILAFEGVFAMALAANTYIEGIGGILESTFRLAGAQLLILSLVGTSAWLVKDSRILGKWPKLIVSAAPFLAIGMVALEGLAVIVLAGNIRIDDFGGVGSRYVIIGGLQMALLAATALLCWPRSGGISDRWKPVGIAAAAFVLLMLPVVLLA